ncbi:RICIN domain-containing protein [Streptomyces longwoodensis]|uniref:NHL domain-containing protein n=1 Tax=Streptomyces longwoodensis TaxID=68231 RepID=UPI00340A144E
MSDTQTTTTEGEDPAPRITTVAGTGDAGSEGDDGPAAEARLERPYGLALDSAGTLYVTDYNNERVRKVTTDGRIRAVAGTGTPGYGGDQGPAVSARLNCPRELAVDRAGNLYIADAENHRIRKVTPDGQIGTVAGTGSAGFSGDDGLAAAAELNAPYGVAVDSTGTLYIADTDNHRVRQVTPDGRIRTVAGTGTPGFSGDGGPAAAAQLNSPYGLAVDGTGTLYIADADNHRIRSVSRDGTISTVAGTGTDGFSGDGGPATSARLDFPLSVAADATGTLYIADHNNHRVRRVAGDGTISTVAGTGTDGFSGDGGPATSARLNYPFGLAVDCVGALYIADYVNNRVRKVAAAAMAGLPESGTVVSWASVRSRLRIGVARESLKDGATIQQSLAAPRQSQRWRLVVAGKSDSGDVVYKVENVRSGKVLTIDEARGTPGAAVVQRAYEGDEAHHQHWRLIPVGALTDDPRVYEIANRSSGLLLGVGTNAPVVITQRWAEGDARDRQWQVLPVQRTNAGQVASPTPPSAHHA